ncbi:hypothetical protein DCAR_0521951 [Daucus carota subsp. sativus]|uniref:Phytocyanin domain-containing protein n=1 Tax=Daucus carota subsp. sativus TaxID=79200 RepID=A0AAF0X8S4_DAUCS|nr:hypothetical protein DCAR_0521951 [Daucus carota subsp. sativus]
MASVMFLQISFLAMMMMPSQAFNYYVGGKDGWSLNPSKSFNDWASQNRFQVHDSLVFKYKNVTDSVLQVNQDDYNTCNTNNPILDHSGLFFFISGISENCNKGQKIIVLVMAPRHASPAPAPSPAPLQGSHSPETSTPPGISPAASVPSEAAAPFPQGPSRAPPPDDGKSASAPALGGDLVTAVLLFWIAYVNCNIVM